MEEEDVVKLFNSVHDFLTPIYEKKGIEQLARLLLSFSDRDVDTLVDILREVQNHSGKLIKALKTYKEKERQTGKCHG